MAGVVLAEFMEAGDGFAGLQGLSRGKFFGPGLGLWCAEGAVAVDKEVKTVVSVGRGEAGVVGRALVAHRLAAPHGFVDDEAGVVAEDGAEGACRLGRLDRTVKLGNEVGGSEMDPAVGGVGGRGDRGGVGHPHIGGGGGGDEQFGRLLGRRAEDFGVGAGEAQPAERLERRALVRRQHGLFQAELRQEFHLGQALESGLTGIRDRAAVGHGGNVAVGEAGVVVGRTDQPVEIDLGGFHEECESGSSEEPASVKRRVRGAAGPAILGRAPRWRRWGRSSNRRRGRRWGGGCRCDRPRRRGRRCWRRSAAGSS